MTRPTRLASVGVFFSVLFSLSPLLRAQEEDARKVMGQAVTRLLDLIEPPETAPTRALTARLKVTRADGLPKEVADATGEIAVQAPSRIRFSANVAGNVFTVCRDDNELWVD